METPEPTKPPKWRSRWPQYRLSTLLVVVTIVGVALGLVTTRAEGQRRAVAAIRAAGGAERYDFELSSSPFVRLELPGPDWLFRLQWLDLQNTQVTDKGLEHLSGLTSLRELRMDGTRVSDAGLVHLSGLTTLGSLRVDGTQVTSAGYRRLQAALNSVLIGPLPRETE